MQGNPGRTEKEARRTIMYIVLIGEALQKGEVNVDEARGVE